MLYLFYLANIYEPTNEYCLLPPPDQFVLIQILLKLFVCIYKGIKFPLITKFINSVQYIILVLLYITDLVGMSLDIMIELNCILR